MEKKCTAAQSVADTFRQSVTAGITLIFIVNMASQNQIFFLNLKK